MRRSLRLRYVTSPHFLPSIKKLMPKTRPRQQQRLPQQRNPSPGSSPASSPRTSRRLGHRPRKVSQITRQPRSLRWVALPDFVWCKFTDDILQLAAAKVKVSQLDEMNDELKDENLRFVHPPLRVLEG